MQLCSCFVPQFMFTWSGIKYLKKLAFENQSPTWFSPSQAMWNGLHLLDTQLWQGYYWVHNTDGQSHSIEQMGTVFITVFNLPSPDNSKACSSIINIDAGEWLPSFLRAFLLFEDWLSLAEHPPLSSSIFSKGASSPPLPLPLTCFHLCLIVCELCSKFCTMLSAKDVRTANKQCVSISKKEELSPSSLQYLFSDFPPLYSAELACGRPLLTTHSLLSPSTDCAQPLPILSPKPLPPPQVTSFYQEDNSAPCFLSGQHGGLSSCMGSRRRCCCSWGRGRSKTHTLQDESGLPCTIQHWWSSTRVAPGTLSFKEKKPSARGLWHCQH